MKILLTGRAGQLGGALERTLAELGEVMPMDRATLDLRQPAQIREAVRQAKPQVIVNAAAFTAVDQAESQPAEAAQVNAHAPAVLAEEAVRIGALLVHFSTDYVFDGAASAPYAETSSPQPLSVYGTSKLEGEQAIAAAGGRYLIARTSWVYGPRAKNFYVAICQKAAAGEPMRFVDDQISVPTPADFLARCTTDLVALGAEGLVHVVPSGQASRFDFAQEVVKASKFTVDVQRARTEDFPAPARRPRYSVLDNRKAAALLGRALPDWRELVIPCTRS